MWLQKICAICSASSGCFSRLDRKDLNMTYTYKHFESSPTELTEVLQRNLDMQLLVPNRSPCISTVAFYGLEPIGMAVAYKQIVGELYISDIRVEKCHQRKGIGTELLRMLEEVVREKGIYLLTLTVHEKNIRAKGLYTKLGFSEGAAYSRPWENWSKRIK